MITPRHEPSSPAAGEALTKADVTVHGETLPVDPIASEPMTHVPPIVEPAISVTSTPADVSLPADPAPTDILPSTAVVKEIEPGVVNDVESVADAQPVTSIESKEEATPVSEPGLFNRPEIRELLCMHEIRIGEGRTIVQVRWSGWGSLRAEAVLDGQIFECRLMYGIARERELDLLVPVGATLTVSVRNLWGTDQRALEVVASDPVLPRLVVPPTPDVINVRMRHPNLPYFPSAAITRLIPSKLRVGVRMRQPLPSIDDRLRHAIALESRHLANLPWFLGSAQRYQRHRMSPRYERQLLSPSYSSLAVSDIKMIPVRDKLKAWMVEIHHGEDETESR